MQKVRVLVNTKNFPYKGKRYNPGDQFVIETYDSGEPTDTFIKRRLKDAEIDNCISIVKKTPASTADVTEDEDNTNKNRRRR